MYESESDKAVKAAVGAVIESVGVSEDKETITIRLEGGASLVGVAYGDCCSQTWVEHATIPPDVAGATIASVEDSDEVPEAPEDDRGEVVQVYGTSVKTDRGEVLIEYRNASNGYYGGWLDWSYSPG